MRRRSILDFHQYTHVDLSMINGPYRPMSNYLQDISDLIDNQTYNSWLYDSRPILDLEDKILKLP